MLLKPKKIEISDDEIENLARQVNHSFEVTKLMVLRGYDTAEKIQKFLNPNLSHLHDPMLLNNMEVLTKKIKFALENKQRVLIFGDYDVDGISATAILYKYFKSKGLEVSYFLPNRYEDGYGLTMETAQKVLELFNPELIITVDCGISCYKEIDFLMQKGVDVVVTDHHEIPEILPSCPVIDAKQLGQQYPFRELCGAGVALKVVQAMGEKLDEYLPICAIATIADIVSLTDENRAIVVEGLKRFDLLPKGVKKLIKEASIDTPNSGDIAFKLAPKINASGRMGDASISLKLYISEDDTEIDDCLKKLSEMNLKRQELCNQIYQEAIELLNQEKQNNHRVIILSSKNWDSGLLGIVCARLTDEFNRPAFLFSEVDGLLKGSVRSIANINIHDSLSKNSMLLETFGGHSMAAGLTLKKENFTRFKYEIADYFMKNYTQKDFMNIKEYDIGLSTDKINMKFVKELDVLEPCGCENPRPVFYTKFSNLKANVMKNFSQHLNIITPDDFSFVCFNRGHLKDLIENSYVCELSYELQINVFKKRTYIKGVVKQVKCSGYKDSLKDYVDGNYLMQLALKKSESKNSFDTYDNLVALLTKLSAKSSYGTLLVCNDLKSAKNLSLFLFMHNFDFHLGEISSNNANNSIVVGLSSFKNFENYSNIVFLEPLLCMDYLNNFRGNLYLPKNHSINIKKFGLDLSHDYFSLVYKKLSQNKSRIMAISKYNYYLEFKRICPELKNLSFSQFVACIETFKELKFLTENEEYGYKICFENITEKKELTQSVYYSRVNKLIYQREV